MTFMRTILTILLLLQTSGSLLIPNVLAEENRPDTNGYIHTWLMLAPIPLEEDETGTEAVAFNIIRRESALQPREGDTHKAAGYERTWKKIVTEGDVFDFNVVLNDRIENAVAYLVTYIHSPGEIQNVTLLAGGNDQTRVYFNGQAVSTSTEPRALTKDSDMAKGLTFQKGVNTVVMKIVNEVGNWQGCLRFTTEDGTPLKNYTLQLQP